MQGLVHFDVKWHWVHTSAGPWSLSGTVCLLQHTTAGVCFKCYSGLKGGGACLQQQAVAKVSRACCSVTPPPFNTAIASPPLKQPEMTELHEIIHFTDEGSCIVTEMSELL